MDLGINVRDLRLQHLLQRIATLEAVESRFAVFTCTADCILARQLQELGSPSSLEPHQDACYCIFAARNPALSFFIWI